MTQQNFTVIQEGNFSNTRKGYSNRIESDGKIAKIIDSCGNVATINASEIRRVKNMYWRATHLSKRNLTKYFTSRISVSPNKRECLLLHAYMLSFPVKGSIDHIDGNGLNNTFENLQICTASENIYKSKPVRSSTGIRGVYIRNRNGVLSYEAQIRVNTKSIFLGCFKDIVLAELAYREGAKKYFSNVFDQSIFCKTQD